MLKILRETSGNPISVLSFDYFPICYRSVATDIISMEEVVIEQIHQLDQLFSLMGELKTDWILCI